MTNKDKANKLVDDFIQASVTETGGIKCFHEEPYTMALQCAKICVQEIMASMEEVMPNPPFQQYWQEVLNHLNEM